MCVQIAVEEKSGNGNVYLGTGLSLRLLESGLSGKLACYESKSSRNCYVLLIIRMKMAGDFTVVVGYKSQLLATTDGPVEI